MLELWTHFSPAIAVIVWPLLAAVLLLGAVAIVSPDTFASLARGGGQWIDSQQVLETLDKKVDIDEHVLRYGRVFGVAVVLAACYLGFVYYTHVLHGQVPFLTNGNPTLGPRGCGIEDANM